MTCTITPACRDVSDKCFARTESGRCGALSEAPEKCSFKKPRKDRPEARIVTEEDLNEIQTKLSHAMVLYPIQRERDFNRGVQKSMDILNAHYKNNKYGYWIWRRGAWICNKCGEQNKNLPEDETIIPMDWTGSKYCPHCGIKMGQ